MNESVLRTLRAVAPHAAMLAFFVAASVLLRGETIPVWHWLNPDEAELMAQGRAAMLSPVPFTTWTMGTTGPFWPLFLAVLGGAGFPLTVAFAHLLAAVLLGIMGYVAAVLLRRAFGTGIGVAIAVGWWLPQVLIFPIGTSTNFGPLSTELLPTVLVLGAALVPGDRLARTPWLFAVSGLLCAVAVGSKYQVLPFAAALALVQVLSLRMGVRASIRRALWWILGAAVPLVSLVIAIATSPDAKIILIEQNFGFLGSYAGGVTLEGRVTNTVTLLLSQKFLVAAFGILILASIFSSRRVNLYRVIFVSSGLLAVLAGGMGFGHYLIILYASFVLAVALPLRPDVKLPGLRPRLIALPVVVALALAMVVGGLAFGRFSFASPSAVAATLSADSVTRTPALERACPEGSRVLVWGWAAEFYVDYSWQNSVPFMNTLGLMSNPVNHDTSEPLVLDAIATSDCIVDAVGAPFFGATADASIRLVYPEVVDILSSEYRKVNGLVTCDECSVYVRR